MATARFRIHPGLAHFLPRERRLPLIVHRTARAATMKNAIEALGIPHTEVARLEVNGTEATLDRIVREGDDIAVWGWDAAGIAQPVPTRSFVADAHLGALARFLRMLGFDTVHDNGLSDDTIRRLAGRERRVVLTRDRELLKCRDIAAGAYVRALEPEAQLREVVERFALIAHARPFRLCLCCNVALVSVDKASVQNRLPDEVKRVQQSFASCPHCRRIYWPGSHYARMRAALSRMLGADMLPASPLAGPSP